VEEAIDIGFGCFFFKKEKNGYGCQAGAMCGFCN